MSNPLQLLLMSIFTYFKSLFENSDSAFDYIRLIILQKEAFDWAIDTKISIKLHVNMSSSK